MKIRFNQGYPHDLCRVPEHVFEAGLNSSSKGRYYDLYIVINSAELAATHVEYGGAAAFLDICAATDFENAKIANAKEASFK